MLRRAPDKVRELRPFDVGPRSAKAGLGGGNQIWGPEEPDPHLAIFLASQDLSSIGREHRGVDDVRGLSLPKTPCALPNPVLAQNFESSAAATRNSSSLAN